MKVYSGKDEILRHPTFCGVASQGCYWRNTVAAKIYRSITDVSVGNSIVLYGRRYVNQFFKTMLMTEVEYGCREIRTCQRQVTQFVAHYAVDDSRRAEHVVRRIEVARMPYTVSVNGNAT